MLVTVVGASASLANESLLTLKYLHPEITAIRSGSSQGPVRESWGQEGRART